MKYKILETEIREAAHHIAKALRAFGNDPIICDLSVLARENSEGNTDSYGFVVRYYPQGTGAVIEKQMRITYADDWAGCDGIINEVVIYEEPEETGTCL